jgi:predicted porin
LKKQLLSTSEIALGVAMAAPATAQEWDMDWGGFHNAHVGYVDVSNTNTPNVGGDFDGVDVFQNAEIIFTPSVTLDNGLTFGVNVQLEGENTRTIDETYMSISSDTLGRIDIGSENSAGYKSMVAAPEVTSMWINSNSTFNLLPLSGSGTGPLPTQGLFVGALGSSYTEVANNNDIDRITYYTPSFNGLVLGVSYARNAGIGFNFGNAVGAANNNNAAGVTVSDIFDIGLNYSQSFGSTDVSIGARYGTANSEVPGISDPSTWGIGMQIGFGDFTVGGHYAENDSGSPTGVNDQEGWSFGASYDAPGPWTFGVTMFKGEGTMNSNVTAVAGSGGNNSTYEAYKIGASRNLGPGVSFDLYAVVTEADDLGTVGTDIDATLVGTAINLSF